MHEFEDNEGARRLCCAQLVLNVRGDLWGTLVRHLPYTMVRKWSALSYLVFTRRMRIIQSFVVDRAVYDRRKFQNQGLGTQAFLAGLDWFKTHIQARIKDLRCGWQRDRNEALRTQWLCFDGWMIENEHVLCCSCQRIKGKWLFTVREWGRVLKGILCFFVLFRKKCVSSSG